MEKGQAFSWIRWPHPRTKYSLRGRLVRLRKKTFKLKLSCERTMFYQIFQLFKSKSRGLSAQNWCIYSYFFFKTIMVMHYWDVATVLTEPAVFLRYYEKWGKVARIRVISFRKLENTKCLSAYCLFLIASVSVF